MARAATFTEASARRIAEVVKRVERDGGGGVRRRGKFDDNGAADTDVSFRVSVADGKFVVAAGHSWYWSHDGAGAGGGYQLAASYAGTDNAGSVAVTAGQFKCVYALVTRTVGSPDTYAVTVQADPTGRASEAAALSIEMGGGWNGETSYSVAVPLVVYSADAGAIIRVLHEGDIFYRDDPQPGSRTISVSGVWPGWKYVASIGGNTLASRYLRFGSTIGSVGGIGGANTHTHGPGGTHGHTFNAESVEVQSGTGVTVAGTASTVAAASDATTAAGDNLPLYVDVIVIEKL